VAEARIDIGVEALAFVQRLAAVDLGAAADRSRIQRALADHFGALQLKPFETRWVASATEGFVAAWSAEKPKELRWAIPVEALLAVEKAGVGAVRAAGPEKRRAAKLAAETAEAEAGAALSFIGAQALTTPVISAAEQAWSYRVAAETVFTWLSEKVASLGPTKSSEIQRLAAQVMVSRKAVNATAVTAMKSAIGNGDPALDRYAAALEPFLEAFEAGLLLVWMMDTHVIALDRSSYAKALEAST
jgi:hypothetical protein